MHDFPRRLISMGGLVMVSDITWYLPHRGLRWSPSRTYCLARGFIGSMPNEMNGRVCGVDE